jgi:conjugal transfer pilus assembly protein TraV
MKYLFNIFVVIMVFSLSSCASIFNPYEESFGCPDGFEGSCDDVESAYNKSRGEGESFSPMVVEDYRDEEPDLRNKSKHPVYNLHRQKVREVKGLIEDPLTPMLIPSKKMRLLVLGYQDVTDDFYSHRFIYFIAEKERWALPFNTMGGGSTDYAESLFE